MSEHTEAETDDGAVSTVRQRLHAAGLSDDRLRNHFEAKAITLDGTVVTDLETPAPPGTRIVFTGC